ncbi:hypothetical protein V6N13_111298 [Hibiscus sabdariffa]
MLGDLTSNKSRIDLMQNYDLPPLVKVFTALDKAVEFVSMSTGRFTASWDERARKKTMDFVMGTTASVKMQGWRFSRR